MYERTRLELPDGDFIDLDYSKRGSENAVIVLHGLEGNADRPYIKGIVRIFNENGWDAIALNFRGCSGEPNRKAQTYHSGATEDLHSLIEFLASEGHYQKVAIIGFSLGGNVTLKYVGERGGQLNPLVRAAVAFSVPIHLQSASMELAKWHNSVYMGRFMTSLKEKIKEREDILKNLVDLSTVYKAKTFFDFDECFTAPVHGFSSAVDYWTRSSSKQFIQNINIPTLLVNARDDSFLSEECYPLMEAESYKNFYLEVPDKGGHVGFIRVDERGYYWSERRALKFVLERS